jgi:hypothetical protein
MGRIVRRRRATSRTRGRAERGRRAGRPLDAAEQRDEDLARQSPLFGASPSAGRRRTRRRRRRSVGRASADGPRARAIPSVAARRSRAPAAAVRDRPERVRGRRPFQWSCARYPTRSNEIQRDPTRSNERRAVDEGRDGAAALHTVSGSGKAASNQASDGDALRSWTLYGTMSPGRNELVISQEGAHGTDTR